MMSQKQKQIIAQFFAHMVHDGSGRGMCLARNIPYFGKVIKLILQDSELFGRITVRDLGKTYICDLSPLQITSFVSFVEEMELMREFVQSDCQKVFPLHHEFTVLFNWESSKETRFLFVNHNLRSDYRRQYQILRDELTALGYFVDKHLFDSSIVYITRYKPEYLAKSKMGKLIYYITHILPEGMYYIRIFCFQKVFFILFLALS